MKKTVRLNIACFQNQGRLKSSDKVCIAKSNQITQYPDHWYNKKARLRKLQITNQ